MRALSFFVLCGLLGCGSRVIDGRHVEAIDDASSSGDSVVTLDSATLDTSVTDSSITVDVEPVDSGPPVCDQPVGSDFTCPTVEAKGAKVCTDAQIRAFMDGCFGDTADSGKCAAAQKKYAPCGKCVLESFITSAGFIDVGACMKKVKPSSTCAGSVDCAYACWGEACSSCDPTVVGGTSEYNDCIVRQSDPSGSCASFGVADYESCVGDPDLAVCVPNTIEDLLPFYRGGCRDGGDWSKASTPDGT